jgi:hypothetical protein
LGTVDECPPYNYGQQCELYVKNGRREEELTEEVGTAAILHCAEELTRAEVRIMVII